MNYYNENDNHCVQWLRNLIDAGHLPAGVVDNRSIEHVTPNDITGFSQHHFFAGIGGWSHALRLAHWPDNRQVWTGSCPCQPFSRAGKRKGQSDARHLWPVWYRLIRECRPPILFGEQVEDAVSHGWYDTVCADMETEGYACAAAILPAACVGAPHARHRLYFFASLDHSIGMLADADSQRCDGEHALLCRTQVVSKAARRGEADNPWRDCDWLYCRDDKYRPVEPGTFPLAHGVPARVGRLRAYGNAIVPQVAAAFVCAALEGKQK